MAMTACGLMWRVCIRCAATCHLLLIQIEGEMILLSLFDVHREP